MDLNKFTTDGSTNKNFNKNEINIVNTSKIDLQRRPVQLEGYRQIHFEGIPGFPNPVPEKMRKRFPKFSINNAITCEDHLRNFLDMMSDYEVEVEYVIMKLFFQSLTKDDREWFKRLLESFIVD